MLMFWIDNLAVLLRNWNMQSAPSPAEDRPGEHRGGNQRNEDEPDDDHGTERAGRDE